LRDRPSFQRASSFAAYDCANKHVAVLMGGFSSERPVSLSSGNACADALETAGIASRASMSTPDVAPVLAD
jgi:D-alanine-D-alanine ligase